MLFVESLAVAGLRKEHVGIVTEEVAVGSFGIFFRNGLHLICNLLFKLVIIGHLPLPFLFSLLLALTTIGLLSGALLFFLRLQFRLMLKVAPIPMLIDDVFALGVDEFQFHIIFVLLHHYFSFQFLLSIARRIFGEVDLAMNVSLVHESLDDDGRVAGRRILFYRLNVLLVVLFAFNQVHQLLEHRLIY